MSRSSRDLEQASSGASQEAPEPATLKPARLIICGGRDFHAYDRFASVMDHIRSIRPIAMVFHGNARGADTLAQRWCVERGIKVFPVPAQWSKYGKRAGPMRNKAMLGQSIDLVVAFPGGKGTEDMVQRARAAGVLVTRAREKSTLRDTSERLQEPREGIKHPTVRTGEP